MDSSPDKDLWRWPETDRRARECGLLLDRKLAEWFEGYLRYAQDDTEARLWMQDIISRTEFRRRTGDPFAYHPTMQDGIHEGDVLLGTEAWNGTPYCIPLLRGPQSHLPSVVNVFIGGGVGTGKSTIEVSLASQITHLGVRVVAFTRNRSFRKKLPPDSRDRFAVLPIQELRFCPSKPAHLPADAPLSVVATECRKTLGRWLEAFGRRYSRQDSILLLQDIGELLFEDLKTFTTTAETREYPSFSDIARVLRDRSYRSRLGGRSKHEESALLAVNDWERWGTGLFDSRNGHNWLELLEQNLVLETDALRDEDAQFVLDFLLGASWQATVFRGTYTQSLELVIILDDFQSAFDEDGVVEAVIRVSRHAGWSFILAPQNPGRASNDVTGNCGIIIIVGAMTDRRDLDQARTFMGLGLYDELTKSLAIGERGLALVRQPMGTYKNVVAVRTPNLPETEYSEQERLDRLNGWPPLPVSTTPATPPAPTEAQDDLAKRIEAFIRSAHQYWDAPLEAHFARAGVRDGSEKNSLVEHAQALGFIQLPEDGKVMGRTGKRIQLTTVTSVACQHFKLLPLKLPGRGSLSTRYYQHSLSILLKKMQSDAVVLEGMVGNDMKAVDVLVRHADGQMTAYEFASSKNADYEIHNLRALHENPELIRAWIIVAETIAAKERVRKQLQAAKFLPNDKVIVTSFFEFTKTAGELA